MLGDKAPVAATRCVIESINFHLFLRNENKSSSGTELLVLHHIPIVISDELRFPPYPSAQVVHYLQRRRPRIMSGRPRRFRNLRRQGSEGSRCKPPKALHSTRARPIVFVAKGPQSKQGIAQHGEAISTDGHLIDEMLDHTPRTEVEKQIFQYYCPICFRYARSIMSTASCCDEHCCLECALALLSAHEQKDQRDPNQEVSADSSCECPFCGGVFDPAIVASGAPPKQYEGDTISQPVATSPVKVGDSFEDLKRKMVSFYDDQLKCGEEENSDEELDQEEGEGDTLGPSLNDSYSFFDQSFDMEPIQGDADAGADAEWIARTTVAGVPEVRPVATANPGVPEAEAFVRSVMCVAIESESCQQLVE